MRPLGDIMRKFWWAVAAGIVAGIAVYFIIPLFNHPNPLPISKEEWISVALDDKYNVLQNKGNGILKYLSKNKDNQLNMNIAVNGLKADHAYILSVNGKPGEPGNDDLKRFSKTDGEGYYDFEEVRTDNQGNVQGDFIASVVAWHCMTISGYV